MSRTAAARAPGVPVPIDAEWNSTKLSSPDTVTPSAPSARNSAHAPDVRRRY